MPRSRGILFLVSAPSGAGKSTLFSRIRERMDFAYSVSATTRTPRPHERDGEHYHFLDEPGFRRRAEAGEFLEWACVHGNLYGTPRAPLESMLQAGREVLLDVDTQGAAMIRRNAPPAILEALADVFILPPSMAELERRLRGRATESEEDVRLRLRNATEEMRSWREFKYAIVSGSPEEDYERFRAIVLAERCLVQRAPDPLPV